MSYDHRSEEPRWQKRWEEAGVFHASDDPADMRPRRYVLDMFPYPSGAGLHVGHPEGYTATDIVTRYHRMRGENVLHPMGWDAFGLPAENYAIKTGVHPSESTAKNIETFRRQVKSLGFSYDWDREVNASDPEYYRWTQWFFLFLHGRGLVERKKAKANWCPSCQTVLANEQVVDGRCERCKTEVIQKELEQWFFKTTQYADRLLAGLDTIDWPEPIKLMQRNWIGRKEGFVLRNPVKGMDLVLESFTTTLSWSFADTFIVIAPEHPLVKELVSGTEQEAAVLAFVEKAKNVPAAERLNETSEKEGMFTGRVAIDPCDGKELPVWVANYAIYEFGTGIVRASAHDTRDYRFAQKYALPVIEVVERPEGAELPLVAHDADGLLRLSGPFDGRMVGEVFADFAKWLEEKGAGEPRVTYRLRDWLVSRQRYWGAPIPIVYDDAGVSYPLPEDELPVRLPTDVDFRPTGESPLTRSEAFHAATDLARIEGKLRVSGALPEGRRIVRRESDTMDTFVCSSWYMYRYCDPQNTETFADVAKIAQWLPVDLYVGGAEHAVLHLLYARFFAKALYDAGLISFDEPFTALRNQGPILAEDGRKMSKSLGNVINPDEVVEQHGADTLRMYEMFMGPIEDAKPWSVQGVMGVRRFIDKVWDVYESSVPVETSTPDETRRLLHRTLKKVTTDIASFRFNTSVSALMIFVNHLREDVPARFTREVADVLARILSPFASHMAESCWEKIGGEGLVCQAAWPEPDVSLLEDAMVTIAIQVNGKARATVTIAREATQEEAVAAALALSVLRPFLGEGVPKRIVYVPGRILNLVV